MRGFGSVQNCYAHEAQMDKLAAAIGMDPVELRMRNAMRMGSTLITGQVVEGPAPVAELLERIQKMPVPPPISFSPQGPGARRAPGQTSGARELDLTQLPGGGSNTTNGE